MSSEIFFSSLEIKLLIIIFLLLNILLKSVLELSLFFNKEENNTFISLVSFISDTITLLSSIIILSVNLSFSRISFNFFSLSFFYFFQVCIFPEHISTLM